MSGAVHLTSDGGIATLRLDNPARLNAFTPDMLTQLAAHCDRLDRDAGIRAVLLTSEGDRAFCAGADIHAWSARHRPISRDIGCATDIGYLIDLRVCPSRLWLCFRPMHSEAGWNWPRPAISG